MELEVRLLHRHAPPGSCVLALRRTVRGCGATAATLWGEHLRALILARAGARRRTAPPPRSCRILPGSHAPCGSPVSMAAAKMPPTRRALIERLRARTRRRIAAAWPELPAPDIARKVPGHAPHRLPPGPGRRRGVRLRSSRRMPGAGLWLLPVPQPLRRAGRAARGAAARCASRARRTHRDRLVGRRRAVARDYYHRDRRCMACGCGCSVNAAHRTAGFCTACSARHATAAPTPNCTA